tara:strand:+ start:181 stop:555 length:375 start_codon:yes stop_codon:yes gene_type:complete
MSSCNDCGDFKIYDDCCDDKDPQVLTRVGLKDGVVVPISIDYLINKFIGINIDSGDENYDGGKSPELNLINVPIGTIFSLILNVNTNTSTNKITINGTKLSETTTSISESINLIAVGKTSSTIK